MSAANVKPDSDRVKHDTRERILEAGGEAILAKSYNGVGLNEILSAAGVPKGSFYHYFKSKEDFGVAVIERSGEEHCRRVSEILRDRRRSPLERLTAFFDWAREYHETCGPDRNCLIAKLALELGQLSEPMRAAIKCAYDQSTVILAQTIREAQDKGQVDGTLDAESLAGFLVNAWEGVTIRMQIDRNLAPIDDFIRLLPRLLNARDGTTTV
jgi:TetR/AcrR family transcriptional repressor of nem operon